MKPVRYLLLAFVALLIAGFATTCRSDGVLFDVGTQYLLGPAPAASLSLQFDGPGDAWIEPGMLLVGQTPNGSRGVMGGQVLLVDGFGKLDLGLGLAYMNREHEQLGSQLNFALLLRYRLPKDWYIAVRHWSNASTTDENTGLDTISFGRRL